MVILVKIYNESISLIVIIFLYHFKKSFKNGVNKPTYSYCNYVSDIV